MKTSYVVRLPDGTVQDALTLKAAQLLVHTNPGAECEPRVHFLPCPHHRGYEAGNCPACPAE